MTVRGIGGVFIYARDAEVLVAWYQKHLAIDFAFEESERSYYKDFVLPADPAYPRREQEVFAIRQADAGNHTQGELVINLRIHDLPQVMARLRTQGVAIEREEQHVYGSFAWLQDGEGNRLELFEPTPR